MKKSILFLLAAIFSLPSFAHDFEYTYEGQTLKYTVLDEEAMTCQTAEGVYGDSYQPTPGNLITGDLIIPSVAVDGDKKYTVTKIGDGSFSSCRDMKSATLPNSVTSIGKDAFSYCSQLTSANIPNAVTSIGEDAFAYCYFLTSMIIPDSVTYIGDRAFTNCTFMTCVNIPPLVTSIGEGVFCSCPQLKSITIPNSVTSIGNSAFRDCGGLESITIPNSVTSIGDEAFASNCFLTVTIGNSVTSIGNGAFENCTKLTSVTIPNSVTTIGEEAFEDCYNLKSIAIPNSVKSIGENAFYTASKYFQMQIDTVNFQDPNFWSQINFGNEHANPINCSNSFSVNGTEVEHLVIDIKNGAVSDYAFYNAYNLKTIRVQAKSIGKRSFFECINVTDLCIETDSIDNDAFSCCSNLKAIYCLTQEPPVAGLTFTDYAATLYVPLGARSKYENASEWRYFSHIVETDFAGIDEIFKADYVDNNDPNAVESIFDDYADSEINFSAPLEVYTLSGALIGNSTDNLAPGIYIVRQGNATKKIAIK